MTYADLGTRSQLEEIARKHPGMSEYIRRRIKKIPFLIVGDPMNYDDEHLDALKPAGP